MLHAQTAARPEIHAKHFFHGYPAGAPATNDLIIRDLYALSSNDETKLADWVAYHLEASLMDCVEDRGRTFKPDPWLADEETLEDADYDGAHAALRLQKGHQAPLASFKCADDWRDTNYLSNITPQRGALNQGSWKALEGRIRTFVKAGHEVWVATGPLYEGVMTPMPHAEDHTVPSGYWKIIFFRGPGGGTGSIEVAAFIFDQATPSGDPVMDHLVTIDIVEQRSGLEFMWELEDSVEDPIESDRHEAWAEASFGG